MVEDSTIRVLIIDDSIHTTTMYQKILEQYFVVEVVNTIKESFDMLVSELFDVVILEFNFDSQIDGIEYSNIIRNAQPGSFILMYSNKKNYDLVKRAINEGSIDQFLNKPVNTKQLRQIINSTSRKHDLITINKNPFFIRITKGNCQIFVSATNEIIDIHETVHRPISVEGIFSKIIPAMMFLRYVFKDHCWHNNTAQGCFIIDDPLLKKKYGYLDYKLLLEAMDYHNFHTSIAFIPWNFKRNNKEVTDLFKERANRFSLCVHGCDHTGGEFGSVDYSELDYRVKQATRRMLFHKEITGLEFDRVMVFPQEVFSTTSLMVLKSNSYLAVVNSGIIPFNWSEPLRIDSLLQPAVMDYENFPIFQRRSPWKIADFALDLFLGKPMLIYVHHDYFREGYGKLKEFMRGINSLVDNIEWKRLEDIIQSSYLQKKEENNITRIKLYTNNMLITNASEDVKSYIITKNETCNVLIDSVMINEAKVPYQINNQLLTVCVKVKPKDIAEIVISYRDQCTDMTQSVGISKILKVFLRRYLSEFRDNYVIRSKILHAAIKRLISIFTHDYLK